MMAAKQEADSQNSIPTASAPAAPDSTALSMSVYAAALASLPGMTPRRLAAVLAANEPERVWRLAASGLPASAPGQAPLAADLMHRQSEAAAALDLNELACRLAASGVEVAVLGQPEYPPALAGDHEAPGVFFWRGDLDLLRRPRVAIVGTRRATRYGVEVSRELGRNLAAAGVVVVSGLALGIDAAAHAGALDVSDGGTVAVVGSGLDVVYPRSNNALWHRIGCRGLISSEAAMGAAPEAWRFPVRNRIIAALGQVLVVVESHARGGSHHSVVAAEQRGRTVMAVPGSIRSSASEYPNQLLADGCPPVRDADDVLVALGLSTAQVAWPGEVGSPGSRPRTPALSPSGRNDCSRLGVRSAAVLEVLGWEPASLGDLVGRSGLAPGELSVLLAQLDCDGWVVNQGGWWQRVGPSR